MDFTIIYSRTLTARPGAHGAKDTFCTHRPLTFNPRRGGSDFSVPRFVRPWRTGSTRVACSRLTLSSALSGHGHRRLPSRS